MIRTLTAGTLSALLILLIFSSCAGDPSTTGSSVVDDAIPPSPFAPEAPSWLWEIRPSGESPEFVAAGPRLYRRDDEADAALRDASVQAGVMSGFWGSGQSYRLTDAAATRRAVLTSARYDGPAADAALENLAPMETWRSEEATWIRYRWEGSRIPEISWTPAPPISGRPAWTLKTPDIPGWYVAVGQSTRRSTMAKTLRGADESALAEMLAFLYARVKAVTETGQSGGSGGSSGGTINESYLVGSGPVEGFFILSRWVDGEGSGYALAICPRDIN